MLSYLEIHCSTRKKQKCFGSLRSVAQYVYGVRVLYCPHRRQQCGVEVVRSAGADLFISAALLLPIFPLSYKHSVAWFLRPLSLPHSCSS